MTTTFNLPRKELCQIPTPGGQVTVLGYPDELKAWVPQISELRYEPFNVKVIRELGYSRFVDVGAAFGFFSHLVSHEKPDVHIDAFEPEPFRYACLKATSGSFQRRNMVVGPGACAYNADGPGGMFRPTGKISTAASSLGVDHIGLGRLIWRDIPTLVKMDIEGNEVFALEHMSEQERSRTSVMYLIELHLFVPGVTVEKVKSLLPFHKAEHIHSAPDDSIQTYLFT